MRIVIWWLAWLGLLVGMLLIYKQIGISKVVYEEPDLTGDYLGMLLLAVSALIRWVILPRIAHAMVAFQLFIIGIVLAELCGFVGLFVAKQWQGALFYLGLLGMIQFMPVFIKRYDT